jgi:hypothetical protein
VRLGAKRSARVLCWGKKIAPIPGEATAIQNGRKLCDCKNFAERMILLRLL